jgi:hypothetical protein
MKTLAVVTEKAWIRLIIALLGLIKKQLKKKW